MDLTKVRDIAREKLASLAGKPVEFSISTFDDDVLRIRYVYDDRFVSTFLDVPSIEGLEDRDEQLVEYVGIHLQESFL